MSYFGEVVTGRFQQRNINKCKQLDQIVHVLKYETKDNQMVMNAFSNKEHAFREYQRVKSENDCIRDIQIISLIIDQK
jgi:hypothetical protein